MRIKNFFCYTNHTRNTIRVLLESYLSLSSSKKIHACRYKAVIFNARGLTQCLRENNFFFFFLSLISKNKKTNPRHCKIADGSFIESKLHYGRYTHRFNVTCIIIIKIKNSFSRRWPSNGPAILQWTG